MIKTSSLLLVTIIFFSSVSKAQQVQCAAYLTKLVALLALDTHLFEKQIAPYFLFSGKAIDDLGYPGSCEKDTNNYQYSTVEIYFVDHEHNNQVFSGYMGFCFVNYCSTQQLTKSAGFIISYILEDYHTKVNSVFVDPDLDLQFSMRAFIVSMLFCIPIGIGMIAPIKKWVGLCKRSENQEFIIKSTYIDLQNPNVDFEDDQVDEYSPMIERLSLWHKFKEILTPETSHKIYGFSLIKILAVPWLILGLLFAESNKAAFNYISYADSVYSTLFAKFALVSYYLPDLFFMMSAYLLGKKLLDSKSENPVQFYFKQFGQVLLRLYPTYLSIMFIYWCISPALHCGPVWYAYQQEAAKCGISWWRALLMIDNWFSNDYCYWILWFPQLLIQYTLVTVLIFSFAHKNRKVLLSLVVVLFVGSFVSNFVFSGQMIVSLEIMLDPYTQTYFRSFYSHSQYYLLGLIIAFMMNQSKVKNSIQNALYTKKIINIPLNLLMVGLTLLIIIRPSVWSTEHSLMVELALCRFGLHFVFAHLMLECIYHNQRTKTNTTCIHHYAYYVYPIILISQVIIQSAYWSVGSFMYINTANLIDSTLSNVIISVSVGLFIGLITDLKV